VNIAKFPAIGITRPRQSYAVDSAEGYQIGNARGDDSQADEPGKGCACYVRVLKAEEAKNDPGWPTRRRNRPETERVKRK